MSTELVQPVKTYCKYCGRSLTSTEVKRQKDHCANHGACDKRRTKNV